MNFRKCNTCQCNICQLRGECGQYDRHPCAECSIEEDDFPLLDWTEDICIEFRPKRKKFTETAPASDGKKRNGKPEYARIRVLKEPNGIDPDLMPKKDEIYLAMRGARDAAREFCIVPINDKKVVLRKAAVGHFTDTSEFEEIEPWHEWEDRNG